MCSKAGPGGHVHPEDAIVLVVGFVVAVVDLFLDDLSVDVIIQSRTPCPSTHTPTPSLPSTPLSTGPQFHAF